MELAIFALFAFLALVSAVVVVVHSNPVYSTLALVVTLVSLAALFVLLGAPFLAALQVLVYTGAILVLFLFVIMLLNVGDHEVPPSGPLQRWTAVIAAGVFALMVGTGVWRVAAGSAAPGPLTEDQVSLKVLAQELFGRYLLPFEIVGLVLLVAVIAATVLARKAPADAGSEEA